MLPDPEPGWGIDRAASPLAGLAGDVGRGSSRTRTAARRVSASTSARLNVRSRDGAEASGCTAARRAQNALQTRSICGPCAERRHVLDRAGNLSRISRTRLPSLQIPLQSSMRSVPSAAQCSSDRQATRASWSQTGAVTSRTRRPGYACFVQRKHCRLGAGRANASCRGGVYVTGEGEDRALAVQGGRGRRSRRFALRGGLLRLRSARPSLHPRRDAGIAACTHSSVECSSALLHASARVRMHGARNEEQAGRADRAIEHGKQP